MTAGNIRELHVPNVRQTSPEFVHDGKSHARGMVGVKLHSDSGRARRKYAPGKVERSQQIAWHVRGIERLNQHPDGFRAEPLGGKAQIVIINAQRSLAVGLLGENAREHMHEARAQRFPRIFGLRELCADRPFSSGRPAVPKSGGAAGVLMSTTGILAAAAALASTSAGSA